MKNISKIILGAIITTSALSIPANAATSSSYSVGFAHDQQRAVLNVHGGNQAAIGTYQNFSNGHVYTKCSTNYGESKSARDGKNAGFMISGTSFTTYHEMVGGGWSNSYKR